jgi:hypothetical protein
VHLLLYLSNNTPKLFGKFFCFVSDELACNSKDVHGYCVTKLSECDGNVKNYTEIYIGK